MPLPNYKSEMICPPPPPSSRSLFHVLLIPSSEGLQYLRDSTNALWSLINVFQGTRHVTRRKADIFPYAFRNISFKVPA